MIFVKGVHAGLENFRPGNRCCILLDHGPAPTGE
jgi:hypothetical protein